MTTAADISPEAVECVHHIVERETAVADGYCPLCLSAENERLRSALTDAQEVARRGDEIILRLDQKLTAAHLSLTARDNAAIAACAHLQMAAGVNAEWRAHEALKLLQAAMEKANGTV